ncbi:MAG: hypothetical protein EB150_09755, partial [Nitrososphaeria archaeon]|nr:hypothetical protein [Nitrososphaeria archaeon]
MQLSLEVQFLDGSDPVTVETTLFTTVLWERKYKRKASELGSAIGQEDLAYLAYEASKLAGIVVPAIFDDYLKSLKLCLPKAVNDPKV